MVGIVALAAALRLVALDRLPPGINQDEANRAYEAWCLRVTGKDHFGKAWPIFFRAFGKADYPPGPYIYALIPIQALLGVNVWSTRLPAALLGTLNVLFLYLLARRLYGERVGLLAALLLAISPWHLHLSRVAFEVSLCPPLVTLALWLITRCQAKPAPGPPTPLRAPDLLGLIVAGLALGLAAWTYNSYRVVVPLLLIGGLAVFARQVYGFLRRPRGALSGGAFALGLVLGLAPFLWASIYTPEEAWGRAAAINVFHTSPNLWSAIRAATWGELLHFNPAFLFFGTDEVQSFRGYPQLHYFCLVLLPLGLLRAAWRPRSERFGLLLWWWVLAAPVPAALTQFDFAHCLRAAGVVPAYELLCALGLGWLFAWVRRWGQGARRWAVAIAGLVAVLNVTYFLHFLFVVVPVRTAQQYQAEWAEVIPEVRRLEPQYDLVVLTGRGSNQLATLYLFWGHVDPRAYFQMPVRRYEGQLWDNTVQVGRVLFVPLEAVPSLVPDLAPGEKLLVAERPGVPVRGRELKQFHYPDGRVALVLYDVELRAGAPAGTGAAQPAAASNPSPG